MEPGNRKQARRNFGEPKLRERRAGSPAADIIRADGKRSYRGRTHTQKPLLEKTIDVERSTSMAWTTNLGLGSGRAGGGLDDAQASARRMPMQHPED
jgi:hypothetical protein